MSYAGFTQSNVPGILKELYDDQKVQWLTYKDNPFLAMVHKEEKFPGKYFPNPVVYSLSSGGASATFANAYANQSSPLVAEFLVTRVSDFSIATIDGQLLAAAQSDPGAFINGSELMIDAAFQTAVNRIAIAMFRDGTGRIGHSSGSISGSSPNYLLTLDNPDDANSFEINQALVGCASTNMQTLISANSLLTTNAPVVQAVDRNAGVITLSSGDASLATDWPSGTSLAIQGDTPSASNNNFQPSGSVGTNSLLKLAGLSAWLPSSVPGSDTFFGVNRALDTQRLAGVFFDGSALSLEEALLQGTGRIAMQGGRVDTGICSYATYTALITSLGSKVQYIDEKIGEIGFRGVQVNGANTVMSIFPDRSCADGVIYCLEMDSWVLRSQNPAPHILKYMDEIEILRVPGVDAAELRVGGYMNMYTKKPGHNGQIQVQLQEF